MDDRSGTLLQCMANQRTNTDSKKPTQGHRWTTIGLLRGTFEFWLDNCSRERMRMDLSSATKCCQRHQYLASKLLYETSGKMIAFDIESSLREQKSSLRGELNKNRKKKSLLSHAALRTTFIDVEAFVIRITKAFFEREKNLKFWKILPDGSSTNGMARNRPSPDLRQE